MGVGPGLACMRRHEVNVLSPHVQMPSLFTSVRSRPISTRLEHSELAPLLVAAEFSLHFLTLVLAALDPVVFSYFHLCLRWAPAKLSVVRDSAEVNSSFKSKLLGQVNITCCTSQICLRYFGQSSILAWMRMVLGTILTFS